MLHAVGFLTISFTRYIPGDEKTLTGLAIVDVVSPKPKSHKKVAPAEL